MAHVQTVLGPIEPDALGFTLPHEHTQIALWHIQSRWDYWQLTRDEPVILDELARFRDVGGSGLVDLTLPGVGRDPVWLRGAGRGQRAPRGHGLRLVPDGLLPAGGTDRSAFDRRSRRRARRGRSRPGWGRRASGRGSSARSAPTSRGSRRPRSASTGRPRARRDGPVWPSPPTPSCPTSAWRSSGSSRRKGSIPARVVIGHADSYPVLDHYLAIIERGANLEFDFLGMPFRARERHRRRPDRRAARASSWPRPCRSGPAEPGRLPRFAAHALRAAMATPTSRRRSCRVCARPASATPTSRR